jgi:ParB-like chromosome segregation protein Spo0J
MKNVLGKKFSSVEMQQRLHIQRFNLERTYEKIAERMEESRKEAKECLAKGDESGFRVASRKYTLSKNTVSAINDLRETAIEMIDLVEMGRIMSSVVDAGGDLAKIQNQLGLDSSKLESSLGKMRASMTHMNDIADALSATIENSMASPELSADQEILRKELLTEMTTEKIHGEAAKIKEQVEKELQKA